MKQKTKIFKIILLIVVIAIMAITTVYLIPTFKELSNEAGQQAFKQKINESGFMGFLMLFGLQFAQIFLFIIPGEPIEILAGLCYGGLCGTVFIMISAAIISAFIYLLVHKLGREFIYEFVKPEKIEKIEKSKKDITSASTYQKDNKTVVVLPGEIVSSETVTRKLEEEGVIDSSVDFDKFLEENGYAKKIRSGKYKIPKNAKYDEIAKIITKQN